MKLLGRGTFSTAYLLDDGNVLLKSCDPVREVQALGWFPKSPLFPTVSFGERDGEYIMPYYAPVKSAKRDLDPDQYSLYIMLSKLQANGYLELYKLFERIPDDDVREALLGALDACSNYDEHVSFEISRRNIAVVNGKLVLRDCFFSLTTLRRMAA